MKLVPWMVLLSLGLISCSGSKSAKTVGEETPQIELSDADEYIDSTETEADIETDTLALSDDVSPVAESSQDLVIEDVAPATLQAEYPTSSPSVVLSGNMMEYQVQKNETLMMISFKLYGDYGQWKKLASWNSDQLKGSQTVREGMSLKYMAPSEEFVWNPQGNPYLIRTGDTLGHISFNVYQTSKKWKSIWDNNKPLIKDPNLIFAGFTIYYPDHGREVASGI